MNKYCCNICKCLCIFGSLEEKLELNKERTSVEKLPDDWYCPLCHKDKSAFDKNKTKSFAA